MYVRNDEITMSIGTSAERSPVSWDVDVSLYVKVLESPQAKFQAPSRRGAITVEAATQKYCGASEHMLTKRVFFLVGFGDGGVMVVRVQDVMYSSAIG